MNDVCDAIQNRLVKLHLTGMPVEEDPEIEAHLATCSTCRIYHDYLNHDHRELEAYAKSLDTYVDHVKQRLHCRIEHAKPGNPSRTTFPWWTVAAAIPLVIGLVFLLNISPNQGSKNAELPTRQVPASTAQAVAVERQLASQHLEDQNTAALLELLNSDHHEIRVVAAQYLAQIEDHSQAPKIATIEPDPTREVTLSPGLSVWGQVTDANGSPVPGAEVKSDQYEKNVYANVDGQYHIDHLPSDMTSISLVVSAENYAPTAKHREFGDREQPIDIVLQKGQTTEGEVVDGNGLPIEGVRVKVTLDDTPSPTGWEAVTDANGQYILTSLPPDTMRLEMTHPDHMAYHWFFDAQKTILQTVLYPQIHVQAEVRDVETESLISSFQLITGEYHQENDLTTWNSGNPIMPTSPGRAEWTFTLQTKAYALMIQAEGYRPALSRVIQPGQTHISLSFEMEKASDTVGTVVTAQGDPAPDMQVFLCQHAMELDVGNGIPRSSTHFVRTDANGRFLVESKHLVKYLVAIGTEGIAQIGYDDFRELHLITLEPWVTVKGDLAIGTQPAFGYMLETRTRDELEYRGGYYAYSHCSTDAQGCFELNSIPPGHMILHGREYEVDAGQTYELHLGVGGQSAAGQFLLPGYTHQERVVDRGHVISLDADKENAEISPLPGTIKSRVFQKISCSETGRFHVDRLEPGQYALVDGLLENRNLDHEKHTYRLWHEFVMPDPSDAAQGEISVELGNVELIPGDLMVGDKAPDFNLSDLEGNTQSLSDVAEKLVLLSFYRSTDLQRLLPKLLALTDVQNQFGASDSFVMIGMLASEYSPPRDRELVNAAELTWPHLAVGRNQLNRTHIEYDVLNTPWPWNILISPDGTVLAIGLQGDELQDAIETHLPQASVF